MPLIKNFCFFVFKLVFALQTRSKQYRTKCVYLGVIKCQKYIGCLQAEFLMLDAYYVYKQMGKTAGRAYPSDIRSEQTVKRLATARQNLSIVDLTLWPRFLVVL